MPAIVGNLVCLGEMKSVYCSHCMKWTTARHIFETLLSSALTKETKLADGNPNKLKHLDYIQAAIARMAQNSFLFKGWAITLASGLVAFGQVKDKSALLVTSLATTLLFWGLDGYYLWLERGFVKLHEKVAKLDEDEINFDMRVDKSRAFLRWLGTCLRWHLVLFYGLMLLVIVIGICKLKGGK